MSGYVKRFLAGLMVGAAIQPASRAVTTSIEAHDLSEDKVRISDEEIDATEVSVAHPELQSRYVGPTCGMSEQVSLLLAHKGGRMVNTSVVAGAAEAECREFVEARTK